MFRAGRPIRSDASVDDRVPGEEDVVEVAEVMTPASVTDGPDQTLRAAAARMWEHQTGSLLVIDERRLVGIVTERDLLRAVGLGKDVDGTTVAEIMTTSLITIDPTTSVHEAARVMATDWIRHLPVLRDEQVVGVVSLRDLAAVLAALGPAGGDQILPADGLVRARRLARIEAGDLD
jgi:CBS domain-containing protein